MHNFMYKKYKYLHTFNMNAILSLVKIKAQRTGVCVCFLNHSFGFIAIYFFFFLVPYFAQVGINKTKRLRCIFKIN